MMLKELGSDLRIMHHKTETEVSDLELLAQKVCEDAMTLIDDKGIVAANKVKKEFWEEFCNAKDENPNLGYGQFIVNRDEEMTKAFKDKDQKEQNEYIESMQVRIKEKNECKQKVVEFEGFRKCEFLASPNPTYPSDELISNYAQKVLDSEFKFANCTEQSCIFLSRLKKAYPDINAKLFTLSHADHVFVVINPPENGEEDLSKWPDNTIIAGLWEDGYVGSAKDFSKHWDETMDKWEKEGIAIAVISPKTNIGKGTHAKLFEQIRTEPMTGYNVVNDDDSSSEQQSKTCWDKCTLL